MAEMYDRMKLEQKKYLEVDEDEILQELTEDELKQLTLDLEEMDPEVSRLGISVGYSYFSD